MEAGTALGHLARPYVESGELVPDDVMLGVVEHALEAPEVRERGFLLDGFPRTAEQAAASSLAQPDRLDAAIDIDLPADEARRRLLARGRADDRPEVIEHRLAVDAARVRPLLALLRQRGTPGRGRRARDRGRGVRPDPGRHSGPLASATGGTRVARLTTVRPSCAMRLVRGRPVGTCRAWDHVNGGSQEDDGDGNGGSTRACSAAGRQTRHSQPSCWPAAAAGLAVATERHGLRPAQLRRQPEHQGGPGHLHEQPDHRRHDVHGRARRVGGRGHHGHATRSTHRGPVDTPIRVRAHRGISSSPDVNEAVRDDPGRGHLRAVLSTRRSCGQIDVKAVYTGNGDARGRDRGAVRHDTPTTASGRPDHRADDRRPPRPDRLSPTTPRPSPTTPPPSVTARLSADRADRGDPQQRAPCRSPAPAAPLLVRERRCWPLVGVVLVTKGRDRHTVPD